MRQRPAEPRRGEAEGGRRRNDRHLARIDMPGQNGADAIMERIARSDDTDLTAAMAKHLFGSAVERARPRPRNAANERSRQRQMAPAAEHELCVLDQAARDG